MNGALLPLALLAGLAGAALRAKGSANTSSAAFRRWFGGSKVVDASGRPLRVYHGTRRADRIGGRFRKARATSGPMAFFTDSPEIASSYAMGKVDTSLDASSDFAEWFVYKDKKMRSTVSLDRAWFFLSGTDRARIAQNLPKVGYADAYAGEGPIVLGQGSIMDDQGVAYELRQARGNAFRAAVEIWLSSGALYDDEERFMEVLAGLFTGTTVPLSAFAYVPPHLEVAGVFPVYLSIQNPLLTSAIPSDVLASLRKVGMRKRGKVTTRGNPDAWDKNSTSGPEWLRRLDEDRANGTTHSWTSIPDWVTETLIAFGYDGIQDTGGKHGGFEHAVWIPFAENQVKSAVSNRGTFDDSAKISANRTSSESRVRTSIPTVEELRPFVQNSECYEAAQGLVNTLRRYKLRYETGAYRRDGRLRDHAWVSTPDGTIVDTTHGQFDIHVPLVIAKPSTPEHRWYLRTDDMSDTQRLEVYGSANRTSSGVVLSVEDAIAELRAAGAPFDVVDEGLETRHRARAGAFERVRSFPYTDRGARFVDRDAIRAECRYWRGREGSPNQSSDTLSILRRAAAWLAEDDPEWVEGGCADLSGLLADYAKHKRLTGVRVVVGWASRSKTAKSGFPHVWLEVDGVRFDPSAEVNRLPLKTWVKDVAAGRLAVAGSYLDPDDTVAEDNGFRLDALLRALP